MPISPTVEGFRVAFRRPLFSVTEIAWRWVTGSTAMALLLFGLIEYLDTLPIDTGDLLLLRTRQPYLAGVALAHIFGGSLGRAALALGFAALLLIVLWICTSSVGRFATVRALAEYFRGKVGGPVSTDERTNESNDTPHISTNIRALLRLNFLRAAVVMAATLGLVGAAIVADFGSAGRYGEPGVAILLFIPLAALICLIAWALNWFLSLAAVFAVSTGEGAMSAIVAAAELCSQRAGAVLAVSVWTGLAHLIAFGGASVLVVMPLAFVRMMPWRLVALASLLVALAYFAFADWVYVARLAGYVCINEMPETQAGTPPPIGVIPPVQLTIDRDELILSDVPNLLPGAPA